ncbi:hypothetical protein HZA76_02340 [Candidatus Roizmanbacteria bacterium]|nr:hypothetical protein [Candidatus Roizmanbacteria bacterium]
MLATHKLEGDFLKKYSVNPRESSYLKKLSKKERELTFKKNLDSYVNHVLEDNVVSTPYSYQLDQNSRIIVYPTGAEVSFDERERGGLYKKGLTDSLINSINHPGRLSFLYSPPGVTSFDNNPDNPYTKIGKYKDGQLYVMYFDGVKINAVAVSISESGETFVKEVLGSLYEEALVKPTEIETISHFISHSFLSGITIDQFLDFHGHHGLDRVIYRNNKDYEFSLWETLDLLRKSFTGNLGVLRGTSFGASSLEDKNLDEDFIIETYKKLIVEYMINNGLKSLKLGGSCGAEEKFSIEQVINRFDNFFNNFSSLDRMLKQKMPKELEEKENKKEGEEACVTCPYCGNKEENRKTAVGYICGNNGCASNKKN